MATGILIIGESGSGKSTSVRNLDPQSTYIINVQNKVLPWKGAKAQYTKENKNIVAVDNAKSIQSMLKNISEKAEHIKCVVIDDSQYIMVNEMMRRSKESGYTKFSEIARGTWDIINEISACRDDLTIVLLSHLETTNVGKEKVKTVGKMLDEQVNIEGMFTIVLKAVKANGVHVFTTKTNGMDTVKSPDGMFETETIPNDLTIVLKAIEEY